MEPAEWFSLVSFLVAAGSFVVHVVRKFGWSALLLKFALLVDGVFVTWTIALHEAPWTAVRNHPSHMDDAGLLWAAGFWLCWSYIQFDDRPMLILTKRPVKWVVVFSAALVFGCIFAAGKGWL